MRSNGRECSVRVRQRKLEELKAKEKARAEVLQGTGKWRHLWRAAGRYANISVSDVADHDELHAILSLLLARHPSAIDATGRPG